ncbi:pectinesterase-like [Andrographis paniculata]|uniref:pectinesterase-like n=1 Tax=Andrographis paniculata TaxID=175694 RepID=UPI0021E94023|nr:pectinesterase-like [Andrographis paniculata]
MGDAKKKAAVAGLASILLVAAVVGVAVTVSKKGRAGEITTNTKAEEGICASTDYKDACRQSIANSNSSDPRVIVQTAIDYTVGNVANVLKNSKLLKDAAADPSTKNALDICDEVLNRAVDDLKRSVNQIGSFDPSKADEIVEDLRTWLSAVITFEETCIDAFENTTGDTGEKMKELLKMTKELSSNGLAMATDIQGILSSLGIGDFASGRKLLWYEKRELADLQPNAVVAVNGGGQFRSINDAIKTVPENNAKPFVILVKAGLYKEYVQIPKRKNFITIVGEGPDKTRIIGNKNFIDGTKTYQSATVAIDAEDFTAKDIAFENSAGPQKHQAVALRVSGDRALFHNVNLDGYQDTLYAHTYRQFYRFCRISGTVDFIFGDALSIFQKCIFVVRKPMDNQACMVTAQGRIDPRSQGAIVIQGGSIEAEPALLGAKPPIQTFLGRPWKELSRTVIMFCNIGGFIDPTGWSPWNGNFALDTLYYAEYGNTGPGADTSRRVKWKGIQRFGPKDAENWAAGKVYAGDQWIRASGIPYWPDLKMN